MDYANNSGTFEGWVADDEWSEPERGAFLIRAYNNDSVPAAGSIQAPNGTGIDSTINQTSGVTDENKPLKNIDFGGGRNISNTAIIFSPKGGMRSTSDVYLVVAEAMLNNNVLFYPGGNGSGSYNWVALKVNRLTGKVEYHMP